MHHQHFTMAILVEQPQLHGGADDLTIFPSLTDAR
jgi:hypothetical protein